jgi:hypothetical protein
MARTTGAGQAAKTASAMKAAAKAVNPNANAKAIKEILETASLRLLPQVIGWVESGATEEPLKAAQVALQLAEFHVPKLQRSEFGLDDETRKSLDTESRRALIREMLQGIEPTTAPDRK